MTTRITLARSVHMPVESVTQTFAILGKRGSGKTVTGTVMAEQMIRAKMPVVVVDPIGVWWGLRHAANGKDPGFPVVILGGEHADVPLEETGGTIIADFIIEHRVSVVLDLGLLSKSAQRRFMVDFAERLYQKNRDPLHVILDECDTFIPQRVDHGAERLVGAINDIVRKGRARGLGVTLISQRPALINKDVLTQIEVLIAHRMTGPQDRDAIERWVEHNADEEKGEELLASLQTLKDGECWIWSPGWLDGLFKRVQRDMRTTFDSSATPKAGERVKRPKNPAEVDLDALRGRLSATIEKAKADDPRELKRRIAELEKRLTAKELERPMQVRVEVPVLTAKQEKAIGRWVEQANKIAADVSELASTIRVKTQVPAASRPLPRNTVHVSIQANGHARPKPETPPKWKASPPPKDATPLDGPMRKILSVLAQFGAMDKMKLALLCGYAHNGGAFNNPVGRLRTAGYISPRGVNPICITGDGIAVLGTYDPLPDDPESLFQFWMSHESVDGPMRSILTALHEAGGSLDRDELASRCVRADGGQGYDPKGGAFSNPMGRLRRIGLVLKSLTPTLAPEISQ